MSKCSTASPACANGSYAKCGQMDKKVSNGNHVSLAAQNRDCKSRQGPGHVTTHNSSSTVSTFSVTPRSHRRRWSADFCKCGTSPVITVKKNVKEPQPPQRGVSLLRPHTASHSSVKRYSCPPVGVFGSPSHPSSSSSSASTSSCSSPPPVQTTVITGPDPLGWKLRPKSSSTPPHARTNRLSLQIPLPVVFPEPKSGPAHSNTTTKTPLIAKPPRRRHSDSSAFLRSLGTPVPVVTIEELCSVHLRPVTLSDESDNVFSEGDEEEVKGTARPRKVPPPVPEKTSVARQTAQLIAHSHQRCRPVTAESNAENIYTSVVMPKPKRSHQTGDHNNGHARKTGLPVDTSCDRERSTPRFPG
ncbi:NHS-like protein 2 [Enoplosus armatus]|uniref:NHS-like protein 2 n=1 Tax=Enoplosus armatus TaxID=215367 RepID=UPI003992A0F3